MAIREPRVRGLRAGERQRELGVPTAGVHGRCQRFVQNQVRLQGESFAGPKLVCIDLQPNSTTQAPERGDILNVGGFSDAVFGVVAAFLNDDATRFVTEVEAVTL